MWWCQTCFCCLNFAFYFDFGQVTYLITLQLAAKLDLIITLHIPSQIITATFTSISYMQLYLAKGQEVIAIGQLQLHNQLQLATTLSSTPVPKQSCLQFMFILSPYSNPMIFYSVTERFTQPVSPFSYCLLPLKKQPSKKQYFEAYHYLS